MSLDGIMCITIPAARYRGYILVKDITIYGPEEKITAENINKIACAVSEFFAAGRNRLDQMQRFGQDTTRDHDLHCDDINCIYRKDRQNAKVRFNKAIEDLETAFKTTGLTAKEFRQITN